MGIVGEGESILINDYAQSRVPPKVIFLIGQFGRSMPVAEDEGRPG
jgi:hypothetical protein